MDILNIRNYFLENFLNKHFRRIFLEDILEYILKDIFRRIYF